MWYRVVLLNESILSHTYTITTSKIQIFEELFEHNWKADIWAIQVVVAAATIFEIPSSPSTTGHKWNIRNTPTNQFTYTLSLLS